MSDACRSEPGWRRSGQCADAACVEAMQDDAGRILLRSSVQPETVLRFTTDEWSVFLDAVTRGDFD
ncbi:DUF397 domain-containing protein [Actinoplanes solisilvae]|uniref:DUF397 domain-containing protein n=1 Tax=Actinoplanes solisilvae TaxID=2486853 RepID=UPI000FDADB4B|nr:DUF397 domain-containing protein [Actinoplanes solisilvae]